MTHITIAEFLETKHDGYEFQDRYFSDAKKCFAEICHWVRDKNENDGELVITICKFSMVFSSWSAEDVIEDILESADVDFDASDLHEDLENNKYGDKISQQYTNFKEALKPFFESLDEALMILEPTQKVLVLKTKEVLDYKK